MKLKSSKLYHQSGEFRALVDAWVQDRHCPIGLVDFLLERGMRRQAEAARWAASRPGGISPTQNETPDKEFWLYRKNTSIGRLPIQDDIPRDRTRANDIFIWGKTAADCLCNFLDAWLLRRSKKQWSKYYHA